MAIEFSCTQCGARLTVRDEDAGKRIRCPHCGMIGDSNSSIHTTPIRTSGFEANVLDEARFHIDEESDRWSMQTQDGAVYGPVLRDELDQWESEGRLSAHCLVQRSGQSHWQSALVLFPHLAEAAPAPVPDASFHSSRDPRAHVGTARRVARGPANPRGNNGPAVLAMGILGVMLIPFPVFAMIAWAMGASEVRAINRGEARPDGRTLVNIGYFLGVFGTCIGVLICLSCCVIVGR